MPDICSLITYPTITLSFQSTSLTLRAPNFGNEDTTTVDRVNIRSRGNDLLIFGSDSWVKTGTVKYDIEIFDKITVIDLQNFIYRSLGRLVGLLDHEGRFYSVIILTGNLEVRHHNVCDYMTTIEFQRV